jgi:N-acetyl-beta-hexosaminidase
LDEAVGAPSSSGGSTRGDNKAQAAPLFPDEMVHLGGDEVDTACWDSTPAIADWMAANGMTADDAYAYFVGRAAAMAVARGKRPVQWSEVYDHFKTDLDPSTVVHVWKAVTNVTEVVANGYDVLVNVGYVPRSWYLDNVRFTFKKKIKKLLGCSMHAHLPAPFLSPFFLRY